MKKWATIFALIVLCSLPGYTTTLRQVTLRQLVLLADKIFEGKVTEVVHTRDESGMSVVVVSVEVTKGIKNVETGAVVQFKQLSGMFPGFPAYTKDQQLLLFLARPSRMGFTAPIALGQGKFLLRRAVLGEDGYVNEFDNRGLFDEELTNKLAPALTMEARQALETKKGPIPRSSLLETINRILEMEGLK